MRWKPVAAVDDITERRRRLWGLPAATASALVVTPQPVTKVPSARNDATDKTPSVRTRLRYLYARQTGQPAPGTAPLPAVPAHEVARPLAKYLSKEWVTRGRAHVEGDARFLTHTNGVHASILCVVHDHPNHADEVFFIDFGDGRIRDIYTGTKAAFDARGIEPTFEVHGDYNTFTQIQEGHLTQATALMRGRLRLKGSLLKALKHMHALDKVTEILREVPTEY